MVRTEHGSQQATGDPVGRLEGIKGQYLLLDGGVLNVRKFRSYVVSVDT